jgi:hypothetical protein
VHLTWVRNTLDLETVYVSEALWEEVRTRPDVVQEGELRPLPFDIEGNLAWPDQA